VDEDILPIRFVAPIGEGARRALRHGPTGGYPVTGVMVRCHRGEYDVLESTEAHFELAGERAMQLALHQAGTEILEPWSEIRLFCSNDDLGLVLSDIASHRGRVVGLEVRDHQTTLQFQLPDRELRTQGIRMEAITGGRAWFTSRPSHYDRLPDEFWREAVLASPYGKSRVMKTSTVEGTDASSRAGGDA
jgi:elongation factor G